MSKTLDNKKEEFLTNEDFSIVLKALFKTTRIKKFVSGMNLNKDEIILYANNNELSFYKAKENIENLTLITSTQLKELKIGQSYIDNISDIKKKLLAG